MKTRPLFDNIVIKPLVAEKKTKAGILLPDNKDNNDLIEGEVIEVGSGDYYPVAVQNIGGMTSLARKPVVVKKGEHVVFRKYAATPIKVDGEKYSIINQKDILAVIDYK